jgi:predicted DNA-binding transcriptional regulator AlpA
VAKIPKDVDAVQDEPEILKIEDLVPRWGVGLRGIMRLLASGRGPRPLRIGRAVRFRLEEVRRWESAVERKGGVQVFVAKRAA